MNPAHSRLLAGVAALSLTLALGCGDGDGGGGGAGGGYEGPDFWVEIQDSDSVEVEGGLGSPVFVLVRAESGEQAPTVTVRAEGLPEGVSAEPIIVARATVRGTLWLMAEDDAPAARDVTVRIVAETFDHVVRETTLQVSVVAGTVNYCDRDFGEIDGLATAVVGDGPSFRELSVLGDGTILGMGGLADGRGWIARWLPNGFADPEFNGAGVRVFDGFVPHASAVAPDGSIYLAGYVREQGTLSLARLFGASLDTTFAYLPLAAGTGTVRALRANGTEIAASIATSGGHRFVRVQPSTRTILAAVDDGPAPRMSRFAYDGTLVAVDAQSVFRFDADGAWDTDFGDAGRLAAGDAELAAVLPDDAGGILIGGERLTDGDALVRRVTGDSIDPGFSEVDWRLDDNEAQVVDLVGLQDGAAAIAYESPDRALDVMLFDRTGGVREEYGRGGPIPLPLVAHSVDAHVAVTRTGAILAAGVATPNAVAICRILR